MLAIQPPTATRPRAWFPAYASHRCATHSAVRCFCNWQQAWQAGAWASRSLQRCTWSAQNEHKISAKDGLGCVQSLAPTHQHCRQYTHTLVLHTRTNTQHPIGLSSSHTQASPTLHCQQGQPHTHTLMALHITHHKSYTHHKCVTTPVPLSPHLSPCHHTCPLFHVHHHIPHTRYP
jgi:hypothetical protein